jgi:hypothetical protein
MKKICGNKFNLWEGGGGIFLRIWKRKRHLWTSEARTQISKFTLE